MKKYLMKPLATKSIVEKCWWTKSFDEGLVTVVTESGWRTGSFSIEVPETDVEKSEWAMKYGVDQEYVDDYQFLPDPDETEIDTEDFCVELLDCCDATHFEFRFLRLPDGFDESLLDEIEEQLSDEGIEYLQESSWDCPYGQNFSISGGVSLSLLK